MAWCNTHLIFYLLHCSRYYLKILWYTYCKKIGLNHNYSSNVNFHSVITLVPILLTSYFTVTVAISYNWFGPFSYIAIFLRKMQYLIISRFYYVSMILFTLGVKFNEKMFKCKGSWKNGFIIDIVQADSDSIVIICHVIRNFPLRPNSRTAKVLAAIRFSNRDLKLEYLYWASIFNNKTVISSKCKTCKNRLNIKTALRKNLLPIGLI